MKIWSNRILLMGLPATALVFTVAARGGADERWWSPGENRQFPQQLDYLNGDGVLRTLLVDGPIQTKGHAFFEPKSTNGRACVTCHQPADAMSLSAATARSRWETTRGKDPLFAAADGSNCPILPQSDRASHSLLLDRGLIRIERPWPPKEWNGKLVVPDFDISVVRDPNGCNSAPKYGPKAGKLSVYRRVRPVANLKYLLAVGFAYDPKQGSALPRDSESGLQMSGNLLADGRAGTLNLQMDDAGQSHLEMMRQLNPAERRQISDFVQKIFVAQQTSRHGIGLDTLGGEGGPAKLRNSQPGALGSIGKAVWSEFAEWDKLTPASGLTETELAWRQSVARGARVFRDKTFLITDTAGINSPIGFGNPVRNSCVFCHNMSQMGNDVAPGQVDLGTTTLPFADNFDDLPLFRITCKATPHPHYGRTIFTYDPGFALTTGRCADVGKITLQSMRGLSARAPYFSNGLAKDLRGVVDYYERRYRIGYTEQEKQDLVNLMSAL